MYKEINPSIEFKELIDTFWLFSKNKYDEKFRVFPDTCTDLIFDLNQNKGYLSATMTNHQQREIQAKSNLIGIRFKSENFGSFFNIPLSDLKNLRIEFSELFPEFDLSIFSAMRDSDTTKKKIIVLENFISEALNLNFSRRDELIVSVAKNIRALKGSLNVVF